jgi:hypothetical protein
LWVFRVFHRCWAAGSPAEERGNRGREKGKRRRSHDAVRRSSSPPMPGSSDTHETHASGRERNSWFAGAPILQTHAGRREKIVVCWSLPAPVLAVHAWGGSPWVCRGTQKQRKLVRFSTIDSRPLSVGMARLRLDSGVEVGMIITRLDMLAWVSG